MCRRSGGREVVVAVGDVVVVVGEAQARLGRRESPSGVKAWGVCFTARTGRARLNGVRASDREGVYWREVASISRRGDAFVRGGLYVVVGGLVVVEERGRGGLRAWLVSQTPANPGALTQQPNPCSLLHERADLLELARDHANRP